MLTEVEINNLIKEEKIITDPPKKDFKIEGQHKRNDFKLTSIDGKRKYSVFLRSHIKFLENFSIGLIYHLEDGTSYNLFRCNGNHGEVVVDVLKPVPHFGFHTHKLTSELIENNIYEPRYVEMTKEYASFEQALKYFVQYVNIKNALEYFPNISQLRLFDE